MTALRKLSQAVVLFVAGAGFLFGQAFAGDFSVASTVAGIGGVLAGSLAGFTSRAVVKQVVLAGCALAVLGVALDVYNYYSTPRMSGGYYAWFLVVPFVIGLVVIAYSATQSSAARLAPGRTAQNSIDR